MGFSKQLLYHKKQNWLGTTEHGSMQKGSMRCAIRKTMTCDCARPCHPWVQHWPLRQIILNLTSSETSAQILHPLLIPNKIMHPTTIFKTCLSDRSSLVITTNLVAWSALAQWGGGQEAQHRPHLEVPGKEKHTSGSKTTPDQLTKHT